MKKDIVFFGIQWAGKTVQSEALVKEFAGVYQHLSPGKLGREYATLDNVVGQYINEMQLAGKMFHSNFTKALVEMFFWAVVDSGKSIIFDGYARNKQQTEHVLQLAKENDREMLGIFLELPEDVWIERLMGRGRSDDTPEAIKNRIAYYFEHTLPWIKLFSEQFELIKIDGNRPIAEISADIKKIVA